MLLAQYALTIAPFLRRSSTISEYSVSTASCKVSPRPRGSEVSNLCTDQSIVAECSHHLSWPLAVKLFHVSHLERSHSHRCQAGVVQFPRSLLTTTAACNTSLACLSRAWMLAPLFNKSLHQLEVLDPVLHRAMECCADHTGVSHNRSPRRPRRPRRPPNNHCPSPLVARIGCFEPGSL